MDVLEKFKSTQREIWRDFAPLEVFTTYTAFPLVKHARIRAEHRVLDVACGTGVVAVTAARLGARVTGLDLTPELLERARENARIAAVEIEWHEGDVENLPFSAESFDVVVSQFGHIFAPRPQIAVAEMLRVLKPGGTLAFSTWPPELFMGGMFQLVARFLPAPPPGVSPPWQWGDPNAIRERLGAAVKDLVFDRDRLLSPAMSPQHHREQAERTIPPVMKIIQSADPSTLAVFRRDYEELAARYLNENAVRQDFLMTRATKL
ncbi:MAG: class I SAM-dependent methyltransferase [Acidobacteria bacterium]|nr:class I SAM-dependent methyltransferase [Acidobacteriota bacterium]